MPEGVGLPAWIGLHLLIACVGTWLARRYALHRRLLDEPGERRSHSVPTPRGGGIAIVAALMTGFIWLGSVGGWSPMLLASAVGLLLVAGIGWIDDHRPLPAWSRLLVHAFAASLLASAVWLDGGSLSLAIGAWIAALVLINVWNFMDGIDGLATTQALLVAAGYAWLAGSGMAMLLGAALAAACAGFLPFNLPRARIFLGDVGSGALGYVLAVILISTEQQGGSVLPVLLLPLSAFLTDAALTLAARILRGERWWQPHVQHAYQCWARRIGPHGVVTTAYAGWTCLAVGGMLQCAKAGLISQAFFVAGMYAVGALIWWWLRSLRGAPTRSTE